MRNQDCLVFNKIFFFVYRLKVSGKDGFLKGMVAF